MDDPAPGEAPVDKLGDTDARGDADDVVGDTGALQAASITHNRSTNDRTLCIRSFPNHAL
jgi:hypothetical protein